MDGVTLAFLCFDTCCVCAVVVVTEDVAPASIGKEEGTGAGATHTQASAKTTEIPGDCDGKVHIVDTGVYIYIHSIEPWLLPACQKGVPRTYLLLTRPHPSLLSNGFFRLSQRSFSQCVICVLSRCFSPLHISILSLYTFLFFPFTRAFSVIFNIMLSL